MFGHGVIRVFTGYIPGVPPGWTQGKVENFKFGAARIAIKDNAIWIYPEAERGIGMHIADDMRVDIIDDDGNLRGLGQLVSLKISVGED